MQNPRRVYKNSILCGPVKKQALRLTLLAVLLAAGLLAAVYCWPRLTTPHRQSSQLLKGGAAYEGAAMWRREQWTYLPVTCGGNRDPPTLSLWNIQSH